MSERMTDDEVGKHLGTAIAASDPGRRTESAVALSKEIARAHTSEEQKDATITQLVSVLESERGFHHSPHSAFGGPVAECAVGRCGVINKALRLVGRL